jgi:hypothetical protein
MHRLWAILYLLFQNNYVRFGALLGIAAGYWGHTYLPGGDEVVTPIVGAFLGWGLGVYWSEIHPSLQRPQAPRRPKFQVHQGGKRRS